jgi:hypothetical protein
MTKRWIISGIAVVAILGATAGIAFAAGNAGATSDQAPVAGQMWATCDAMHASPSMEAMRAQMPAALRAQCDAMHEQMAQMMGGWGMMNGSGMMGGASATDGSMATHHSSTER